VVRRGVDFGVTGNRLAVGGASWTSSRRTASTTTSTWRSTVHIKPTMPQFALAAVECFLERALEPDLVAGSVRWCARRDDSRSWGTDHSCCWTA
jgi:hypothetical protein